ncbi:hypothetical protein MIMGU_mgv1a012848mg [Erythranthe guttata]|uniref:Cystatin domain-containing protein n=1 Tax=Erythranthe guttata TaxID=4155 RepID=A0A022PZ88_ERYGU|nr:PREDICTED: uncharacterized protein LOC105977832 [Erythranthe guttata]EYU20208.1 hypothetical protein MIMGU_mgv1a012848mg [Erythranthe guttata]|eukprot:XP_012858666.1 PREDICTED: uncharacterized protein LOC105977832 [Erythranthe guttata]
MNQVKTEAIPMKGKPGGGPRVWFDGDRTDIDPLYIKDSEDAAALAIDVYNKTHLNRYSVVEVLSATGLGLKVIVTFTAKPEPGDDDKNLVTFVAFTHILNESYKFVISVKILHPAHLRPIDSVSEEKEPVGMFRDGPVLYGPDCTTCCDDETKNILNESTDLALEVYNKTHMEIYNLLVLVSATGHLSTGSNSKVDLMFTAEPDPVRLAHLGDPRTRSFQARVSFSHKYVEFVDHVSY